MQAGHSPAPSADLELQASPCLCFQQTTNCSHNSWMHQVTSAHQLAGCQQLPALPSRAQLHRWSCLARFKRTDLEDIVQQAQEPPQITHPVLLPVSSQAPPAVPQQQQQASPAHPKQHAAYSTVLPQQRQQQQLDDLVISKLRPSRMDFAAMYAQLAAWQQRFLSAHVPRHCFDAPELGAWVRYLRKQHKDGHLEQWKVDRWGLWLIGGGVQPHLIVAECWTQLPSVASCVRPTSLVAVVANACWRAVVCISVLCCQTWGRAWRMLLQQR